MVAKSVVNEGRQIALATELIELGARLQVLEGETTLSRERLIVLTRAPGVEVNDRSIDLSISRLRRKLGDVAQEGNLIRTLRGEGYLFDAEVQW